MTTITSERKSAVTPGRSPRWLIVLGLILLQGAFTLWHLAGLKTIAFMDTSHYFVVAKNIAHSKANPDTVVWHFIGSPASVDRPAGDYWGPGWPYLLSVLMRCGGDSTIAVFRICALLSTLLPVAVFLLLERLTENWRLATFGGVLVCLQTRLFQTMVTPDVSLSYDLAATIGLFLFLGVLRDGPSRGRLLSCTLVLSLPMWLRGEGFVPLVAAMLGLLAAPWPWRMRMAALVKFAGLAAICLAPFFLYDVHFFGNITPKARALTPFVTDYKQLYEVTDAPTAEAYWSLGFKRLIGMRLEALKNFLSSVWPRVPYIMLLAALFGPLWRWIASRWAKNKSPRETAEYIPATRGAAAHGNGGDSRNDVRGDWRRAAVFALLSYVVLSATIPLLLAPIVYNPSRFFTTTACVLCVLAVWAIEPLLRSRWSVNCGLMAAAILLFAYLEWPLHFAKPWRNDWNAPCLSVPSYFLPENHPTLTADDIVLTEIPCQLAAQLDCKAVNSPLDGVEFGDNEAAKRTYPGFLHTAGLKGRVTSTEACRQVIERFQPRFILAEEGSNLEQFVNRMSDLPLRALNHGKSSDGRGFAWYRIGDIAPPKPN